MKQFVIPKKQRTADLHREELRVLDNGYFDTLVAIGYAALADSYYDSPSPIIERTATGFAVEHGTKLRDTPHLGWLKYSLAASWKKEKELQDGPFTKKDKVWDGAQIIEHENAVVDTETDTRINIELGKKTISIQTPERELYAVFNKLGSPKWLNACIFTCRYKGLDLLTGKFEEELSINSIALPQSSKGAMSSGSFSIANGSMPGGFSKAWSREICLAVAGLIAGSRGCINNGFVVPVPLKISFDFLRHIVSRNRKRIVPKDFFFPYNNYLYYLKMLTAYGPQVQAMLSAVCGARFIELGTQSSPAGNWSLTVPKYAFSFMEVDDLMKLLENWRSAVKPKNTSPPNIDRLAVDRLMRGFERGEIQPFTEGYLSYITTVGFNGPYKPSLLHRKQFFTIMASNKVRYHELIEALRGPIVEPIIKLIRQDTYNRVFRHGKQAEQPDYNLIRRFREVQNHEDLVSALCEVSIKRSIDVMAAMNSSKTNSAGLSLPTQSGIARVVSLSEDPRYSPKLIAQLLLAMALSKKDYYSEEEE